MPEQQHLDVDLHVRYIQQLDTVSPSQNIKTELLPPDPTTLRTSSTKMT